MHIDFLRDVFMEAFQNTAIVFRDRPYQYEWLVSQLDLWAERLAANGIASGAVVALKAGYSATSIAVFLSLIERGCIVIPVNAADPASGNLVDLGQAEFITTVDDGGDHATISQTGVHSSHALYDQLRATGHPGMVLFSSGSTGKPKGVVHDLTRLLTKYHRRRHNLRTLAFLLFDHIGGFDTLLYCLSNGSCLIIPKDRTPDSVCAAIQRHRVEVLPVAPTFLNLLILSETYQRYDLTSLKFITYGAEVMPEGTLRRCAELFPSATLLQKYGTSEVGTLRSRSKSSDSLWVKIGGEGYQWRVIDGILQIKAESAMLGYLNAPSPFTADGWFITGDCVEVNGDHLRVLGRVSDIINVGGQKVYPTEVEDVLREVPNVADVTVYGEPHPLIGNMVVARIQLLRQEDPSTVRVALREYARKMLEPYKVPIKIVFSGNHVTERFKKVRRSSDSETAEPNTTC